MFPATFRSIDGDDVVALQVTDENLNEIAAWTNGEVVRFSKPLLSTQISWAGVRFNTDNGVVNARTGEWVVQNERLTSQFKKYPDHIFKQHYYYI